MTGADQLSIAFPAAVEAAAILLGDMDRDTRRALENPSRVRNTDPIASHEAAEIVTTSGLADAQAEIALRAVERWPNLTALELAAESGIDRYLLNRRLPELRRRGFVVNGESRPCRKSPLNLKSVQTWRLPVAAVTAPPAVASTEPKKGTTA